MSVAGTRIIGPGSIGEPVSRVEGRDGRDYPVWKNPHDREFAQLIAGSPHGEWGGRAVLTEHDVHVWNSMHVLHGDFVRQIGVDGVRIRLQPDIVLVNEETVGIPFAFPWIFDNDGERVDVERRREIVERWLNATYRLTIIYPRGFTIIWYM